ncbi:alpha/beta hydrolase [Bradyrhizobium sp. Pear76]|uniref:alpha/beta hydrolase n=1 Tax=Bradyrhizobium oropedii TaxID=1571201 RepID=UPI001E57A578|nr:alpha/beta hydrolase [Bradyrhizobium oropedii]MCC8963381.1 alpha/beta hydrolase [Bradyrhizobium oropedii]
MSDQVRVRFATNRNPVPGPSLFGPKYRDNNPKHYVTGSIEVRRLSNLPDTGWVPDPNSVQLDSPIDASVFQPTTQNRNDIATFARDRLAAELASTATSQYGLILLPGFDSTFMDSMSRAAQVMSNYKAGDIFCFSWPSQGKLDLASYKADRDAAAKSANAVADSLRRLFAILRALKGNLPILHIVAHSMGNYALQNAVQLIPAKERSALLFESAFLMAADVNYDALSKANELKPLITLAKKVLAYKNGGDLALSLSSSILINNYPRLGQWGPRDLGKLPKTVNSVDCSDVGSTQGDNGESHYGHQYYRLSPWVLNDVVQVLAGIPANKIAGRLPAIPDEGGRAWWIPYDSGSTSRGRGKPGKSKGKPARRKK